MEISDKVICVNDSPCQREEFFDFPNGKIKEQKIYVISDVIKSHAGLILSYVIVGFPVICKRNKTEMGWHKERFIPLKRPPLMTV